MGTYFLHLTDLFQPKLLELGQHARAFTNRVVCVYAQSCPTFSDPIDCGPPLSGIFQAKMLEWVASSYSRRSVQWREVTNVSCIGRWILITLRHLGTPSMVWILEISCQNLRILVHRNLNV